MSENAKCNETDNNWNRQNTLFRTKIIITSQYASLPATKRCARCNSIFGGYRFNTDLGSANSTIFFCCKALATWLTTLSRVSRPTAAESFSLSANLISSGVISYIILNQNEGSVA
jgi:hypothetical protein